MVCSHGGCHRPWLTSVWCVGTGLLGQIHGPGSAGPRPAHSFLPRLRPCRGDVRLSSSSHGGPPRAGAPPTAPKHHDASPVIQHQPNEWPARPLFPQKVTFEVPGVGGVARSLTMPYTAAVLLNVVPAGGQAFEGERAPLRARVGRTPRAQCAPGFAPCFPPPSRFLPPACHSGDLKLGPGRGHGTEASVAAVE